MDGKSWWLLGVLREHRGAVEYDFRARFGVGLSVIGRGMSLAEAARHVERFRSDPSSALAAEVEGWDHPVSRLEVLVMDLWDLTAASGGSRTPPRYPRPWRSVDTRRHGDAAGRSPEEVKALLRERFGRREGPV